MHKEASHIHIVVFCVFVLIAKALRVSVSTIKRRLREFNISSRATLTEISDHDLDSVVRSIHTEFPNAGYRRVLSQVILRGIKMTQRRVRKSMQRTDADGVAIRWQSITPRPQERCIV